MFSRSAFGTDGFLGSDIENGKFDKERERQFGNPYEAFAMPVTPARSSSAEFSSAIGFRANDFVGTEHITPRLAEYQQQPFGVQHQQQDSVRLSAPRQSGAPQPQHQSEQALLPGPECPCGAGVCPVRVSRSQNNPGRQYAKCPSAEGMGNNGCGFFEWLTDADGNPMPPRGSAVGTGEPGAGPRRQSTGGVGNAGRECFKCGQLGHWARDCPGGAQLGQQGPAGTSSGPGGGPAAEDAPMCPCGGGPCRVFTSKSAANPGRRFAKCPRAEFTPGSANKGCGFFEWMDQGGSSGMQPAVGSTHQGMQQAGGPSAQPTSLGSAGCFKCGEAGHWARDCPNQGRGAGYRPQARPFEARSVRSKPF